MQVEHVEVPCGRMAVAHHGDRARPVDILFLHANGMNADTYRSLLALLPSDLHAAAVDQRGHGATALPLALDRGWTGLRDDLLALLDAMGATPAVLAGHSMGGTVALLTAAERRVADRLVLFDPVWGKAGSDFRAALSEGALRRRARFADREEAWARLHGRGAFATWPDAALADYLDGGLRPEAGSWVLSCPPEQEAANFRSSPGDLTDAIRRVDVPTRIVLAEEGTAWCPPADTALPPAIEQSVIAGTTHFLPLERRELAAAMLRDAARAAGR